MSEMRLMEVSILTGDLPAAMAAWASASGLQGQVAGDEARIEVGDIVMRLLTPAAGLHAAEAIAERGEGLFELIVEVDDVVDTMAGLRIKDVLVSGVELGEHGRREVRIDPKSSHGVPIRLVEKKK